MVTVGRKEIWSKLRPKYLPSVWFTSLPFSFFTISRFILLKCRIDKLSSLNIFNSVSFSARPNPHIFVCHANSSLFGLFLPCQSSFLTGAQLLCGVHPVYSDVFMQSFVVLTVNSCCTVKSLCKCVLPTQESPTNPPELFLQS